MVNICVPSFDPCDSYGRIANELVSGLAGLDVPTNQISLDGTGTSSVIPSMGGILLGYPTLLPLFGGMTQNGPKVMVTMFESTVIPGGWIEPLNQCQAVIVPSRWLVEVFRSCGVTAPIYVVPLGISETFMETVKRERSEPFTFLAIADRGRRKGWQNVGMAFNKAFGKDEKYRLIFKSRNFPVNLTNPNIEIIEADFTDDEMLALYRSAHVMPFPTCGEGFGFPPREFAATGGLALATNWGGTADDLDQWGLPIPHHMQTAWEGQADWHGRLGDWADVEVDVLADYMRHIADHYESYTDFAIRAAGYVTTHYRWSRFAREVYSIWQQAEQEFYHDSNRDRKNALPA